jgi:hypothetical protein
MDTNYPLRFLTADYADDRGLGFLNHPSPGLRMARPLMSTYGH